MLVRKQDFFKVAYCMLIAITIFAPERFGTTLKYGIVPIVLMILFANIQKSISRIGVISVFFVVGIVLSTVLSDCAGVDSSSANLRSLIILIILFSVLSNINVEMDVIESVKTFYIICTIFCGIWIVGSAALHGLSSIDRYNFSFIWGLKDVNYLLAYMLPGCYMAIRKLLYDSKKSRVINIVCVISVFLSILFLETRASFVTVIIVAGLLYLEFISADGLNVKKVIITVMLVIAGIGLVLWIFSNPAFSRLTSVESYEDNIRLVIWGESLKGFTNHKIIGSGLGAASYYSSIITGYQSHNNYIDILCDFGILGSFIFCLLLREIFLVPKGNRLHMAAFMTSALLPLAFINGFQTLVFWVPMILLVHENIVLNNIWEN